MKPPNGVEKNPLTVSDILGAKADTKGLGVFEHAVRQNKPFS